MTTRKKRTVRSNRKNTKPALPGAIYLNKNRYWWKVQLPGEAKAKARPLRALGSKFATTDYGVAVEVASNIWQEAIYRQNDSSNIEIVNVASLVAAYLKHVDEYYRDESNNQTMEVNNIRYSVRPLVDVFGCHLLEEFGPLRLIELREHMITILIFSCFFLVYTFVVYYWHIGTNLVFTALGVVFRSNLRSNMFQLFRFRSLFQP